MSEVSRFRLDELLSQRAGVRGSPISAADAAAHRRADTGTTLADVGIEPITVAISGMKFPSRPPRPSSMP